MPVHPTGPGLNGVATLFDMGGGFRNVMLLLARVGIGVIFIAHGWQKLIINGMDATVNQFRSALTNINVLDAVVLSVPSGGITVIAYLVTFLELLGGLAIIVGFLTTTVGWLLFLDMLGAFLLVHLGNGVFVEQGGYELVVALGAACIFLAVGGAGKIGISGTLIK